MKDSQPSGRKTSFFLINSRIHPAIFYLPVRVLPLLVEHVNGKSLLRGHAALHRLEDELEGGRVAHPKMGIVEFSHHCLETEVRILKRAQARRKDTYKFKRHEPLATASYQKSIVCLMIETLQAIIYRQHCPFLGLRISILSHKCQSTS